MHGCSKRRLEQLCQRLDHPILNVLDVLGCERLILITITG
jgi:hypothetical protein